MPTTLRRPDGTTITVGNEDIVSEVEKGATPPRSIRIDVPLADGSTRSSEVPYETFLNLSKAGNTPQLTSDSDIRGLERIAELEDETSALGSFVRGAGEELTFGLYEPSAEQQLADETYHNIASTMGKIGGAVGPLLVPGVGQGALAGRLAGTGARVARGGSALSRVGRGAVELLPGRALAQVGAGVSERLGGRLAGNVVGGAVEEAGRATLRAAIDDDIELSAESILASSLAGGIGGGVGYGLSKGADAISRLGDDVARKVKGKINRQPRIDEDDLVKRLNTDRDPTPAQLNRTEQQLASDVRSSISQDVTMAGANREMVKDVTSLERSVKGWRDGAVSPRLTKADMAIVDEGLDSAKVLRTFGRQSPAVQSRVMASYGQHLQNVDRMSDVARRNGLNQLDMPVRFAPDNVMARQRSLDELQSTGSPVEDAAQRLSLRLTVGVQGDRAAQDVATSLLSKLPIVGGLVGKAKDHPLGSLFILGSIMDGGLGVGASAAGAGLGAYGLSRGVKALYGEPGRGLALSSLSAGELARLGLDGQDPDDVQGTVRRIRGTSPDQRSQEVARSLAPVSDRIGDDAVIRASQAAANRWSALQERVDGIFGRSSAVRPLVVDRPTPKQRRELVKAVSISSDPNAFARLWSSDRLSKDDLVLAERTWPGHVRKARERAMAWLSDQGDRPIPRNVRRRLELLLGEQAVGMRKDLSALATQEVIMQANARRSEAIKAGPRPSTTGLDGTIDRGLMPPGQVATSRPSDG